MGRETHVYVRDGLVDPRRGPGRDWGHSDRSETGRDSRTGRGTIGEIRDELGILEEVQDGSGNPWGSPGRVGRPSRRFGTGWGPSGRSGMGQETLREVWDGSWRSGTGRGTLGDVWDGSGDPW